MPPLSILQHLIASARKHALEAVGAVEHSTVAKEVEDFARHQALVFAGILITELREQFIAHPPTDVSSLILALDETLAGAAARYEAIAGAGAAAAAAAIGKTEALPQPVAAGA
jgi:hypothetical protein